MIEDSVAWSLIGHAGLRIQLCKNLRMHAACHDLSLAHHETIPNKESFLIRFFTCLRFVGPLRTSGSFPVSG